MDSMPVAVMPGVGVVNCLETEESPLRPLVDAASGNGHCPELYRSGKRSTGLNYKATKPGMS